MKLAADFRQAAREALRGKWPIAILIGLVAVLLGGKSAETRQPRRRAARRRPGGRPSGRQPQRRGGY